MIIKQSSIFNVSPEQVWQEGLKTKLLHYVASPILKFTSAGTTPLPEVWKKGEYTVNMKVFGFVPFGKQKVVIKSPPEHEQENHLYAMLDDGRGELITKWRHLITIDDAGTGKTLYTDQVEVQAGVLTIFVWVFANIFFWHRQRRWKKLIKNNFIYQ